MSRCQMPIQGRAREAIEADAEFGGGIRAADRDVVRDNDNCNDDGDCGYKG